MNRSTDIDGILVALIILAWLVGVGVVLGRALAAKEQDYSILKSRLFDVEWQINQWQTHDMSAESES